MAKKDATVTFSTERHSRTVFEMHTAREDVRAKGIETIRRTGAIHPFVDVTKRIKRSRNSIVEVDGKLVLVNGPALGVVSGFDGTASMGINIQRFFDALVPFYDLLAPVRGMGYDLQMSAMMFQDKDDILPGTDNICAVMQTEFESGNRFADQIRQIVYSNEGGDSTEEYQFALLQAAFNDLDIRRHYGLKGYFMVGGDEIGRQSSTPEEVMRHLGRVIQNRMTIKQMYQAAAQNYHVYRIQCGGRGSGASRDGYTEWWEEVMGAGHVVVVHDMRLLAEIQAALIWAGETQNPTEEGLIEFIVNGTKSNVKRTADDAKMLWDWIMEAGVELGVQTKLPNWGKLPAKGSVFSNYRHAWPIDDPRAVDNVIDTESDADAPLKVEDDTPKRPDREKKSVDWSNF